MVKGFVNELGDALGCAATCLRQALKVGGGLVVGGLIIWGLSDPSRRQAIADEAFKTAKAMGKTLQRAGAFVGLQETQRVVGKTMTLAGTVILIPIGLLGAGLGLAYLRSR